MQRFLSRESLVVTRCGEEACVAAGERMTGRAEPGEVRRISVWKALEAVVRCFTF